MWPDHLFPLISAYELTRMSKEQIVKINRVGGFHFFNPLICQGGGWILKIRIDPPRHISKENNEDRSK